MSALLALLSSLLWGSADFTGGTLSRRRPALAVVGASQAVGLLAVAVVAVASGAVHAPTGYLPWGVLAGLAGFAGLLAFYAALATGTMGVVSPIAAAGVVVPVVVGMARGEQPAALQLAGIVITVGGIVLASGPELSGRVGLRPVLLAVVAAVCFGVALAAIVVGSETDAVMTMTTMRCSSVSLVVVIALARRSLGGLDQPDLPALVFIGLGDVGANLTFGVATTYGLVSIVAVLGSLYPVFTVLLARFVHHERLVRVQQAGVVTALAGVALIAAG